MPTLLAIWILLSLLATLVAAGRAWRRRHNFKFYLAAGLLLGPGVLGLDWGLTRQTVRTPWERYHSRLLDLLAALVVIPPFALAHGSWLFSAGAGNSVLELWNSMSLALPLPTVLIQQVIGLYRGNECFWMPFALFGPGLALRAMLGCSYRVPLVGNLWRTIDALGWLHSRRGSWLPPETQRRQPWEGPLNARALRQRLEVDLLSLAPRMLFLQSWLWALNCLMALGLLLPFQQMSGWIGG